MPVIHAIVSDLDDTLLTEDHRLTPRTERTLRRLIDRGVKVILASGRSAASVRQVVRQIGTPDPYIGYNGAQILDSQTHEVLHAEEIPLALAREVLKWFEARSVYMQYYQGDDWYCAHHNDISRSYGEGTGIEGTEAGGPLSAHIQADTPKLLGVDRPERAKALIQEAQAHFGKALSITTSKPHFVEITSPRATKGNAVAVLAQRIGLSPETTICAGDSLNDVSMLAWSRLPVSVENAREEVKAMAWRIAGNGQQDGLAILLDELIP